jgi:hypothetical protein
VMLSDRGMPGKPLDATVQEILSTVKDRVVPRFLAYVR